MTCRPLVGRFTLPANRGIAGAELVSLFALTMTHSTIKNYRTHLNIIADQAEMYLCKLAKWVRVNSVSGNLEGLTDMVQLLESDFQVLGGHIFSKDMDAQDLLEVKGAESNPALSRAFHIHKRPHAPLVILLCGHMDTVMEPTQQRRTYERNGQGRFWGSGAMDAKGGLAVILAALNCFEASPFTSGLGWEVLIVPDEETGSHASRPLLIEAAARCHLGLVFEPAFPDGNLVGGRMGSGNFEVNIHGRPAHAGRNPEDGRNAIEAAADLIVRLKEFRSRKKGIRINVGEIRGGGSVNVVPDFVRFRFNVRAHSPQEMEAIQKEILAQVEEINQGNGFIANLKGSVNRPPKLLDKPTLYLLQHLAACGHDLGMSLNWFDSGGVCDGNTLAAAGLTNVDSLGPVGEGLHTHEEYVWETSIADRARLVALFLMRLSCREIPWPPQEK